MYSMLQMEEEKKENLKKKKKKKTLVFNRFLFLATHLNFIY